MGLGCQHILLLWWRKTSKQNCAVKHLKSPKSMFWSDRNRSKYLSIWMQMHKASVETWEQLNTYTLVWHVLRVWPILFISRWYKCSVFELELNWIKIRSSDQPQPKGQSGATKYNTYFLKISLNFKYVCTFFINSLWMIHYQFDICSVVFCVRFLHEVKLDK